MSEHDDQIHSQYDIDPKTGVFESCESEPGQRHPHGPEHLLFESRRSSLLAQHQPDVTAELRPNTPTSENCQYAAGHSPA